MLLFAHLYLYLLLWLLRITKDFSFYLFVSYGLFESLIQYQLLVQTLVKNIFINRILNGVRHALCRV
jgi:hypothetical protein